MKKYIALVLVLTCVLGIVGCAGRSDLLNFKFGNVSKMIVISVDVKRFEVTDTYKIRQITENIESIQFEKGESSENTNGFGPFIQWYDANDNLIESISVMAEETIIYDGFFWTAIDGNIDYAALNEILENGSQTDTEENGNTIDTENELSWANGTQIDGTLFQNLNLDGIGDSDDEAYVSIYQFGDYEEKVTVISIHLGTGETVAQVFPVYGDYSLQTGKVFSEEKDAIILEVCDSTSNYGAATVFVLNVSPVDVDPIPTVAIRLDTAESIMLANGNIIENSVLENNVTSGTEVVNVEDMPRQGVLVYFIGEKGHFQEVERTLYWTDNGWTIISEEIQE